MNNITINQIEVIIKNYLIHSHPKHSNGFIIRLSEIIKTHYEKRKSYIVNFPLIDSINNIDDIVCSWSNYLLDNLIDDYDLTKEFTISSIDPINIQKIFLNTYVQYSGETISPEILIKSISVDIIEQMNKLLIEKYMDEFYPELDIDDSEQNEQYNQIFDMIDMEQIYESYPSAEIYLPLKLNIESKSDTIELYLNAIISTKYQIIDIIDDLRICFDFNDTSETLVYDKEEIIYKFSKKILTPNNFSLITDPIL